MDRLAVDGEEDEKLALLERTSARHVKLSDLRSKYWNDRDFVLTAVRSTDSIALKYASRTFRSDKEVVLEAVRNNGCALEYASEDLRGDREVVWEAIQDTSAWIFGIRGFGGLDVRCALRFASEELRDDKELVLVAVSRCCHALAHASQELRRDKEVVMKAVTEDAEALQHVCDEMRRDRDILLQAIATKNCASVLIHAPNRDELFADLSFVGSAIRRLSVSPLSGQKNEFDQRLRFFPNSLQFEVSALLRNVIDSVGESQSGQRWWATTMPPSGFAAKWLSNLEENHWLVSKAISDQKVGEDVGVHIVGLWGLFQEKALASRLMEYAPVIEALLADPGTSSLSSWLHEAAPRFIIHCDGKQVEV